MDLTFTSTVNESTSEVKNTKDEQKNANGTKIAATRGTSKINVQEYSLADHWLNTKKEVDFSNKTPNKVVRRVLAYFRTLVPKLSTSQAGINPLGILPKEMWEKILNNISKPFDLLNCAQSCALFKGILEERKTQVLFEAVLPHIVDTLKLEEILKCRLVCKQWDKAINTLVGSDRLCEPLVITAGGDLEVENYLQLLTIKPRSAKARWSPHQWQLYEFYKFSIPNADIPWRHSRLNNCASIQTELKLHPRNPFVGGNVLVLKNTDFHAEPGIYAGMINLFNDIGRHITSLDLRGIYTERHEDICTIVSCIFKTCLKLKWFDMGDHSYPPKKHMKTAMDINAVPEISSLRQINIGTLECNCISHALFAKYSNQLIGLHLKQREMEFFSNLLWQNLKEMTLDAHLTEDITTSLGRLDASQLSHLVLYFSRDRTTLKNIIQAINSFARLTSLQINFCFNAVMPDQEEILSVPVEVVCRSSITSLILKDFDELISCDFLLCFPLLKKLVLCVSVSSYKNVVDLVTEYTRPPVNQRYIKLKKYLAKRLIGVGRAEVNVCMSNIWEVCPFLQTLNIKSGDSPGYPKKVFTRSSNRDRGYGKKWKKYKMGLFKK